VPAVVLASELYGPDVAGAEPTPPELIGGGQKASFPASIAGLPRRSGTWPLPGVPVTPGDMLVVWRLDRRWREMRACNDNTCGESKGQNSHDSLLDLTFLIVATDPKVSIY